MLSPISGQETKSRVRTFLHRRKQQAGRDVYCNGTQGLAQNASYPTECQNYLSKNAEFRACKSYSQIFNPIALGMPVFNGNALPNSRRTRDLNLGDESSLFCKIRPRKMVGDLKQAKELSGVVRWVHNYRSNSVLICSTAPQDEPANNNCPTHVS